MEVFARINKKFLLNTIANSLNDMFFKPDGHNEENIESCSYFEQLIRTDSSKTYPTLVNKRVGLGKFEKLGNPPMKNSSL